MAKRILIGLLGLAVTAALVYGGQLLWDKIPTWRKKTPLANFKILVNVISIFAALTVVEWIFDAGRWLVTRTQTPAADPD